MENPFSTVNLNNKPAHLRIRAAATILLASGLGVGDENAIEDFAKRLNVSSGDIANEMERFIYVSPVTQSMEGNQ